MEEFVQQHAGAVVSIIGLLLTLLGFLALRVLKQIDSNQQKLGIKLDGDIKELNTRVNSLEKDFYRLQGEHIEATHPKRTHEF